MAGRSPRAPVPAWLVSGLPGAARARAIVARLAAVPADAPVSLLLEGAPADGTAELAARPGWRSHVLAPACPCCIGNLALRVTLARVLRQETPAALLIAIADATHLPRLERWLRAPPWDAWLMLRDGADWPPAAPT